MKRPRARTGRLAVDCRPAETSDPLRPWWLGGLTALLVATPIVPSESTPLGCGSMALVLGWFLLVLAWFAAAALRGPHLWRAGPALAVVVLLLGWYTLSVVVMGSTGQLRAAINMLWQWIGFGFAFFLTRQLVSTSRERRALVVLYLGLAVGMSVTGYVQYFYENPSLVAAYEQDPVATLREAGVVAPPGSPQRVTFENRLASKEPFATFALANSLAGFLSPWLIVALGSLITGWNAGDRPGRMRWVAAATSLCIAGCWLLTKSRAAVLATVAGVVLLIVYGRRSGWRPDWRWVVGLVAAAVLLPIATFVVGGLDAFVLLEASKSMLYRVQYWRATAGLIADNPWFGCGPGNFQLYYTAYKLPEASETVAEPHNFAFEIWATAGTPAILLFLAFLASIVWQAWRAARRFTDMSDHFSSRTNGVMPIYLGGFAGCLGGYLMCGLLEGYLPSTSFMLLGLPAAVAVIVGWQDWVTRGNWPVAVPAIALGVLLVNLLAAGGIGFASVAQTFWVLAALLLSEAESDQARQHLPRWAAGVMVLVVLTTLAVFAKTSYLPQLGARTQLMAGDAYLAEGKPVQAWEAYRGAAVADPFASDSWQRLAGVAHQAWLATHDHRHELAFREALVRVAELNPRSNAWQMQVGRWWLAAYRRWGQPECLQEAIAAFRIAVKLYPNYNLGHAELAWALYLAGDQAAVDEADEALRLDRLNPHREQKLSQQRLSDDGPPSAGQRPPPGELTAEQVMHDIRKNSNLGNPS